MVTRRDEVLEALDVLAYFGAQGIELKRLNGVEYKFLCPFHEDHVPSANVAIDGDKKGVYFCHACGATGTIFDFVSNMKGVPFKDALATLGEFAGKPAKTNGGGTPHPAPKVPVPAVKPPTMTDANVAEWHKAALRNRSLMSWFADHRGYTVETVERYELGWDGERVTIPVREADGTLANVRRYKRDSRGTQQKMLSFATGTGGTRLFPLTLPLPSEVILVEGEWDAILMRQQGFTNTLTVTSGAGVFPDEYVELFKDRKVIICYDNDEAGRNGSLKVAAKLLPVASSVAIAEVDGLPEKGDVTDFFVELQRSPEELRTILDDAHPYLQPAVERVEGEAVLVPLYKASDSQYAGQRLRIPVLLSGKAQTPYTVPFRFLAECDMGNKRLCGICPMKLTYKGHREVQLSAMDPALLSLVNVPDSSLYIAQKKLAEVVGACNRPTMKVLDYINIEEMRVVPEIDSRHSNDEAEYVARMAYYMGHGLLSNRGYELLGYTHPHPKTQATVHVISEAIPAQDNISSFAMTPELYGRLRLFQTRDLAATFADINDDFARNVHRIQDRLDMQIAYDLVWHSVIGFYFNGAWVRRGWVECMVMGDSGQGKTEMAMALIEHYGLGRRVQGEQSSQAGLIAGVEKLIETWMISWGALPQNDKRLLVIDETQGLAPEQIEAMSDVRATGVAEVTKIRTERTNARCRLIWLANPTSGMPLAGFNQGVQAIKELFKKPEDIRRLDLALTVASGEVNIGKVNALHAASGDAKYPADLCRALVLWAWSRDSTQVTFTPGATEAILAAATTMGERYHSSIPLVEPADQRLKLARLAVAAAARTFSTDDGTNIIVRPEHVAFVVGFLDRIYNSRSMSYGEYSTQTAAQERLGDVERDVVVENIKSWTNSPDALAFFRGVKAFKKTDLNDVVGWTDIEARSNMRLLQTHRLITQAREGWRKTPMFISLLRDLLGGTDVDDEVPEGPF